MNISIVIMLSTLYGNYSIAGKTAAISVISFAVGAPYIARLVDRYGQFRVLRFTLAIAGLTLLAMTFLALNRVNPIWVYLLAAISAASSGATGSMVRARWAYILDSPTQIRTAFAFEAALDEIAFMTGPVVATVLTTSVHLGAGLFFAVGCIFIGGYWYILLRSTEPPAAGKVANERTTSLLRLPAVVFLALTNIGAGLIFGIVDVATVAFATEHGSRESSGVILGVFAAGSFISALLYGARNWRIPQWKLYAIGVTMLAVGCSLFFLAHSTWALALIMFFTGFSISPTLTNVSAIISQVVDSKRLTEGFTWMTTAMNVGVALGAMMAGYLIDYGKSPLAFGAVVVCAWIMFFLMLAGLGVIRRADRASRPRLEEDHVTDAPDASGDAPSASDAPDASGDAPAAG